MTDTSIIVGVPTEDLTGLQALTASLDTGAEFSEHRYIDGATYIEAIVQVAFSTASWATLREWIRARADIRKTTRITFDGVEITAMSRKDAERLIELIRSRLSLEDGDN